MGQNPDDNLSDKIISTQSQFKQNIEFNTITLQQSYNL